MLEHVVFDLALEQGNGFGIVVLLADQVLRVERRQGRLVAHIGHKAVARANAERHRLHAELGHQCARHVARGVGQDECLLHLVVSSLSGEPHRGGSCLLAMALLSSPDRGSGGV